MSQTLSPPGHVRIADEVRVWLTRRKISAAQVAQKLGWSQKYLSRRLTGEVPFRVDELIDVTDLLEIPLEQLFEAVRKDSETPGRAGSRINHFSLSSLLPLAGLSIRAA